MLRLKLMITIPLNMVQKSHFNSYINFDEQTSVEVGDGLPLETRVQNIIGEIGSSFKKEGQLLKSEPFNDLISQLRLQVRDVSAVERSIDSVRREIIKPVKEEIKKSTLISRWSVAIGILFGLFGVASFIFNFYRSDIPFLYIKEQLNGISYNIRSSTNYQLASSNNNRPNTVNNTEENKITSKEMPTKIEVASNSKTEKSQPASAQSNSGIDVNAITSPSTPTINPFTLPNINPSTLTPNSILATNPNSSLYNGITSLSDPYVLSGLANILKPRVITIKSGESYYDISGITFLVTDINSDNTANLQASTPYYGGLTTPLSTLTLQSSTMVVQYFSGVHIGTNLALSLNLIYKTAIIKNIDHTSKTCDIQINY